MKGRTRAWGLVGVALSSAAVLVFEIVLTQVFSVAQFYHFAFLTVSLALLGFGASGSVLAAFPRLGRGGPRRWALLALAQGASTLAAYGVTNRIPFDSFAVAWDRRQIFYLIAYYTVLATPFFFGGAVIGTLLAGWDQPVPLTRRRVYGASLIGAGLGCVVAVGALPRLGGVGTIVVAAVLGLAAAVVFEASGRSSPVLLSVVAVATMLAVLLPGAWPAGFEVRLSPYKDLSTALRYPGAEVVATSWDSSSQVDHVTSGGIRSLPGLSYAWVGTPPRQDGVTFDGDDLSPIPLVGPGDAEFATHLLNSVGFTISPGADVLVLEPRGGLDVLVALALGAGSVTAVESHGSAVDAASRAGSPVYAHPAVEVVIDEPRSFAERTGRRFDVVDIALTAPYRPVTSGAYSLSEDYLLTVEAFDTYLDLLRPGGVVTVMRWLQTPPSEEMRLLALAAEAVHRAGSDPSGAIIALRGYATAVVLVKPDGFSQVEVDEALRFADRERFDVIAAPDTSPSNVHNVLLDDQYARLAASILTEPEDTGYEFDISPPSDDRPFFTHFFKWAQASDVLANLGRTWQPFGGAGFFVLLALLALSALAAVVLVLGPLAFMTRRLRHAPGPRLWTISYFGLLGLAFLLVEIPLVQQYILVVGRPSTALAVVLFALLLSAGIGSIYSDRLSWRRAAAALAAAAFAYPFVIRWFAALVLPAPLVVRLLGGVAVLVPLGFLMGTMFPKGLNHLERDSAHLIPWAWGINGTTSVIAAVAAALLALSYGFRMVLFIGAVCYLGCALLALRADGRVTPRPG